MKTIAALILGWVSLLSVALPAQAVPFGLLLESDTDRGSGSEFYALTYDSWDDALANNIATQAFTPLDINPLFGSAGFTLDGSAYRLLLESNADRTAGSELYELTYNTWGDVLTNTIADQGFYRSTSIPCSVRRASRSTALPTGCCSNRTRIEAADRRSTR